MVRFDDDDPNVRGHWLRVPFCTAVAAILVMLAVSRLLILFMINNPIEVISR